MEYQYHYEGKEERKQKIAGAEGLGYRMLHDNLDDPKWKRGDPMVGTLIFTDVASKPTPPDPDDALAEEIVGRSHKKWDMPDLQELVRILAKKTGYGFKGKEIRRA